MTTKKLCFCFLLAGCGSAEDLIYRPDTSDFLIDSGRYEPADDVYTNAVYSTYGDVIVIHHGYGGYIDPIIEQYEQWAEEGKTIIVDGQVISVDAFGAFMEELEGQVCYTNRAVFSPHAASFDEDTPDYVETERLTTNLIDPLEQEFRLSPYFREWVDYAEIDANRLQEIWPEGQCSPELLAYTRLEFSF